MFPADEYGRLERGELHMLSSDSFFSNFTNDQMIALYRERARKLREFRRLHLSSSLVAFQESMFRQARRVLHKRGIEDPPLNL